MLGGSENATKAKTGNPTCSNAAAPPASAFRARPCVTGMSVTSPACQRPWPTSPPGLTAPGTASPMQSRGALLIRRWRCPNSRRVKWQCALPTRKAVSFQRLPLSPAQIPRSDPKSGIHRDQGCRGIPYHDHRPQPALADGVHLSEGHRLGVVTVHPDGPDISADSAPSGLKCFDGGQVHSKDFHSRRGLLVLVGQRRGLLDYLKKKDQKRYETLIGRLGLRR